MWGDGEEKRAGSVKVYYSLLKSISLKAFNSLFMKKMFGRQNVVVLKKKNQV